LSSDRKGRTDRLGRTNGMDTYHRSRAYRARDSGGPLSADARRAICDAREASHLCNLGRGPGGPWYGAGDCFSLAGSRRGRAADERLKFARPHSLILGPVKAQVVQIDAPTSLRGHKNYTSA